MADQEKSVRAWYPHDDPNFVCYAPPKCCLFCSNLISLAWDYSNGPYLIGCGLECHHTDEDNLPTECGGYDGTCPDFIESNEYPLTTKAPKSEANEES